MKTTVPVTVSSLTQHQFPYQRILGPVPRMLVDDILQAYYEDSYELEEVEGGPEYAIELIAEGLKQHKEFLKLRNEKLEREGIVKREYIEGRQDA